MNPFLRLIALLMVLLAMLSGCGKGRSLAPPGKPYAVTLADGVLVTSAVATSAGRATGRPGRDGPSRGGSGGGCGGNFLGGGGKEALLGLAAVIAVVLVVATVVCVVDSATGGMEESALDDRYHLTLTGDGAPPAEVVITASNHLYLEPHQYDALVRGSYTRTVLRPAVWEGTRGAPTQEVRISLRGGLVSIAPLESPPGTP